MKHVRPVSLAVTWGPGLFRDFYQWIWDNREPLRFDPRGMFLNHIKGALSDLVFGDGE